jgi:hypothetical protein
MMKIFKKPFSPLCWYTSKAKLQIKCHPPVTDHQNIPLPTHVKACTKRCILHIHRSRLKSTVGSAPRDSLFATLPTNFPLAWPTRLYFLLLWNSKLTRTIS